MNASYSATVRSGRAFMARFMPVVAFIIAGFCLMRLHQRLRQPQQNIYLFHNLDLPAGSRHPLLLNVGAARRHRRCTCGVGGYCRHRRWWRRSLLKAHFMAVTPGKQLTQSLSGGEEGEVYVREAGNRRRYMV